MTTSIEDINRRFVRYRFPHGDDVLYRQEPDGLLVEEKNHKAVRSLLKASGLAYSLWKWEGEVRRVGEGLYPVPVLPRDTKNPAVLRKRRDGGYSWVIPSCIACSEEHWHGGGNAGSNPFDSLGHRCEHCLPYAQEMLPRQRRKFKAILPSGYTLTASLSDPETLMAALRFK